MSKNNTSTLTSSHNIIAEGTKITGRIDSKESIRLDGSLEGDIDCKGKIIVGASCVITGNVTCQNLELMGTINGNIICSDTVIFRSKSKLEGDLKTNILEIEPGAYFSGSISMKEIHAPE